MVKVTKSTTRKDGACNACHDQIDEHGTLNAVVFEITLQAEGSNHSSSFRLCKSCLAELRAEIRVAE